ncbi:MAG: MFS transporter [Ktedonobacterales bacterium]|nr:MFS transporter [Ktedonobacterales bacterium]
MSIPQRMGRTFDSLSIYNYRLFWFSQLISVSGTWMQTTAQAWLVLKLTNSSVALGTVVLLQFLPVTVFTLFGGVLADRLPKRAVLLGTQSVAAVQALLLAILVITNTVQLWQIYGLALLLGIVNAFDTPTRQSFVSELVGPARLPNAVALNSTLFNAARIVGPALGGIIISVVDIGQAFLFNAISFVPVLAALLLMRAAEFHASARPARGNIFRQVGEGIRYAVRTPSVLIILLTMAVVGTFGYNYNTILPLLAKYVLHAGATGLGLLTSAVGIGSLVAALVVAATHQATQRVLLAAAFIFSLLLMAIGFSPSLPLTLVLLVLMGIAGIVYTASSNSNLQMNTPGPLRGRVMSLYILLFMGTTPIGGFLVGVLSARIGVQPTIVLMGAICLVGVVAACGYAWLSGRVRARNTIVAQPSLNE